MSVGGAKTLRKPAALISTAKFLALMKRASFGRRVVPGAPADPINGYALVLAMPGWINELLGHALPARLVKEAQLIQANLLVHLQYLDDALDGQSQAGRGNPAVPLMAAHRRLARLFPPADPFWFDFRRLGEEQQASARWEATGRHARSPPFDDALLRAIAGKAALVRWPAAGMARLARRPPMKERLDPLLARFLALVLLFDDLTDVEEDASEGRINAVLCAARDCSRDAFRFYPGIARGAHVVCSKVREELARLKREVPSGSAFARVCEYMSKRCAEVEESFAVACQVRLAGHMAATLANALRVATC